MVKYTFEIVQRLIWREFRSGLSPSPRSFEAAYAHAICFMPPDSLNYTRGEFSLVDPWSHYYTTTKPCNQLRGSGYTVVARGHGLLSYDLLFKMRGGRYSNWSPGSMWKII
jgi:hypothetical protein